MSANSLSNPFASASDLVRALAAGEVSSRELLDMYLGRVAEHNPKLNAICVQDGEASRERADALDAIGRPGALHGLPITLKESSQVAGLPWTAGIPALRGNKADANGPAPERMFAAGGVLIGKTNIPPFLADWQADNEIYGRTVNPWDSERSPGGSTGGGAAALAAGLTPLEIGSDIGGSIRVPAAFCGLFGHRPSDSAVPRSGSFPPESLPSPAGVMGVQGPLARSAEDLELALDILAGPEPGEEGWQLRIPPARHERFDGMRVAVLPAIDFVPVDDTVSAAVGRAAEIAALRGARVQRVAPEGWDARAQLASYWALLNTITLARLTPEQRAHAAETLRNSDDDFKEAKLRGLLASANDYFQLMRERELSRRIWGAFFQYWDVILTPVVIGPAFKHDQTPFAQRTIPINGRQVRYDLQVFYPAVATFPGLPATAIPAGRTNEGLPVGIQVIAPNLEDRTAIRTAALFEAEGFRFEPPPDV
ncbi:MAG: amidase [Chloroflexi bacterium]|nr:amidase [Chloroflexota bacterium]